MCIYIYIYISLPLGPMGLGPIFNTQSASARARPGPVGSGGVKLFVRQNLRFGDGHLGFGGGI